jgi:hypothetical protein
MNDEIAQRLWSWSMHTGDSLFAEAADEIARLNDLVAELVPYMLLDVRSGLELGTPTADCCDNCGDCDWYAEAMDWVRRIESGELGDVKFAFFP